MDTNLKDAIRAIALVITLQVGKMRAVPCISPAFYQLSHTHTLHLPRPHFTH